MTVLDDALIGTTELFGYVAAKLGATLDETDAAEIPLYDYIDKHRPPAELLSGEKSVWALTGGRGSAKTFCASIYYNSVMRSEPGIKGRLIGPTVEEVIESCVTGTSGLLTLFPDLKLRSRGSSRFVVWPNGSEAVIVGVWTKRHVPKLRALGNRTIDWFEEFTHIPLMQEAFEQAALGRRIGQQPQAIITTTPTAHPYWAQVLAMPNVVATHATMFDNPHLSDAFKREILEMFAGTSLEGQEIYGEILTDIDGACWNSEILNKHRLHFAQLPDCELIGVGVDPATESGTTGIVVSGSYRDSLDIWNVVALEDRSSSADPDEWGREVIRAADDWSAHFVVAERNQGGKMVAQVIRHALDSYIANHAEMGIDKSYLKGLKVKLVHARDGKHTRAQPISMLFEQGRGQIFGRAPLLENQLTTWVPGDASPDRLDAMVWVMHELVARFRRNRGRTAVPTS